MPMHISPRIDMGSDHTATAFPRMSPNTKSLPPATQNDILGILQREQDHAMALLSSSPLLASLFITYANQAAGFESSTPPTESEEWKALKNTVSRLQEEVDKLRPENLEMTERLTVAAASLEAFRSQVTSLKGMNTAQQLEFNSLQAELSEFKVKYNRLVENSTAERDALQNTVSDLKAQQAELKETLVIQQLKLSKVGLQHSKREEDQEAARRLAERAKRGERKRRERAEREAKKERREQAERDAREKARREEERVEHIRPEEREASFTDAERELSPTEPTHPTLAPEVMPEAGALSNSTSELPKMPQDVRKGVPGTPASSFIPAPRPVNAEQEKPLSLWDRKRLKAPIQPAHAPAQKSSGWGSWGNLLFADAVPPPEPSPTMRKIEDPPRGFPSQPPESQPAGFFVSNEPARIGPGGSWDNPWGSAKNSPTPISQKTPTGIGKLTTNTAVKPLESSPNTAKPEDIPDSVVNIKRVPALGTFHTEETAAPTEEDDFAWANWERGKKKKKGKVAGVNQTTSLLNNPDPDNVDGGIRGGETKTKKGKREMKPTMN